MYETLVSTDWALARHRDGPLSEERNRYLRHWADLGGTRESLRTKARSILWVAERMSPEDHGHVDASRLHEITYGLAFAATPAPAPKTAARRINDARSWLRFLDWWREPEQWLSLIHI